MSSHHRRRNPNIASVICTNPQHNSRGTAGTIQLFGTELVPMQGAHVYPGLSGDPAWGFQCPLCRQVVVKNAAEIYAITAGAGIGQHRVELDIHAAFEFGAPTL